MPDPDAATNRHARLRELFASALNLTPSARERWLEENAGGDRILLEEVRSLLDADAVASELFTTAGQEHAATLAAHDRQLAGSRLGRFQLGTCIGTGGMGQVYRAWDRALDRPAAIKVLRPEVRRRYGRRLLREAEAAARLQHPSIATFFEGGEEGGITYLAMELVEGTTLRRRLADAPLSPPQALSVLTGVLEALAHAHASGLLHRDTKPENVMLTPGGRPKLLDFGIARPFGRAERGRLPVDGGDTLEPDDTGPTVAGTPGYMSPEQLRGEVLTPASDVFQAGVLLYEMLTGRALFGGASAAARIAATLAGPPVRIAAAGVEPRLAALLASAVSFEPAERFQSAAAFLRSVDSTSRELPGDTGNQRPLAPPAGDAPGPATAGDLLLQPSQPGCRESQESPRALPLAEDLAARARQLWQTGGRDAHARALALLDEALARRPDCVEALGVKAAVHATSFVFSGDPADLTAAIAAADGALRLDPAHSEAWCWRGYALVRQKRLDEALTSLERAAAGRPNAMAAYLYGSGLCSVGRFEEAVSRLQQAVDLERRHAIGWLALGWTLHSLRRDDAAVLALERARSLEGQPGPNFLAGVGGHLAECLRALHRLDDARQAARQGLDSIERSDVFYRDTIRGFCLCALGRAAFAQGDGAGARAAFSQAVVQHRSRRSTIGAGHVLVQALAGLAMASGDHRILTEALETWRSREGYSFDYFFGCSDDVTAFELAVAAHELGEDGRAAELRAVARAAGSRRS